MGNGDAALREQITETVCNAMRALDPVLAGWESGSAAFGLEDEYSDLDLNFLLDETTSEEQVYPVVEAALETVSPIVASHSSPPGCYYKLRAGSEFLLLDVCLFRACDLEERLDPERHGTARPLFDQGAWLRRSVRDVSAHAAIRDRRLGEIRSWFSISQVFVRKEILRDRQADALTALWGYTLKPLVEILRMRYCPQRWDFGMRYLDRDLPEPVYAKLRELMFVGDPDDLSGRWREATGWAEQLLGELEDATESTPATE